jgi:uncharacterized protein (DUF433 family)
MNSHSQHIEVAHPHVERRSGAQGGRAIIKGTRVLVSSIVQNYRRGLSVDEILREFPHLTPAQVYDALSYYYDNQTQVDHEIAELGNWRKASQEYPPTMRPRDDGN